MKADNTKVEAVEKAMFKFKAMLKELKEGMDGRVSIADFNKYLGEVMHKVEKNHNKSSLVKECQKDRADVQKQLDKHHGEHEKLAKQVKKLERKADDAHSLLEGKVDTYDLDEVRDILKVLPRA